MRVEPSSENMMEHIVIRSDNARVFESVVVRHDSSSPKMSKRILSPSEPKMISDSTRVSVCLRIGPDQCQNQIKSMERRSDIAKTINHALLRYFLNESGLYLILLNEPSRADRSVSSMMGIWWWGVE
jgi:hypothetical protein